VRGRAQSVNLPSAARADGAPGALATSMTMRNGLVVVQPVAATVTAAVPRGDSTARRNACGVCLRLGRMGNRESCPVCQNGGRLHFGLRRLPPSRRPGRSAPRTSQRLRRAHSRPTDAELVAVRQCAELGRPFGDEGCVESIVPRLGLEPTMRPRGRQRVRPVPEEQIKEACPLCCDQRSACRRESDAVFPADVLNGLPRGNDAGG